MSNVVSKSDIVANYRKPSLGLNDLLLVQMVMYASIVIV